MEKESCTKFCGVFVTFQKVVKLQNFEFSVSTCDMQNIFHRFSLHFFASFMEKTRHANCGLHANFGNFLLMQFCFMRKKDHFKQKLLLWSQVPFKEGPMFFTN